MIKVIKKTIAMQPKNALTREFLPFSTIIYKKRLIIKRINSMVFADTKKKSYPQAGPLPPHTD
jgi:hypothetical protein